MTGWLGKLLMSKRLNQAIRELNIGLNTAVEFLSKKPELGEVKPDPSCKISDEQYNALSAAFAKDKEVRDKAGELFHKKPKAQKQPKAPKVAEPAPKVVEEKKEKRQEFKPLGKIDLDALNGKKKPEAKAEKKAEPAPAPAKEAPKAEARKTEAPKVEAPKPEAKNAPKPEAPKAEPAKVEPKKAEPVKAEAPKAAPVEEKEEKPGTSVRCLVRR